MRWTCATCGGSIRFSGSEGTNAVRCGRCKQPVPNPAIVQKVTSLNVRLQGLLVAVNRFSSGLSSATVSDLERSIEKEQAIMKNMAANYPGWAATKRAYLEIFNETDFLLIDLKYEIHRTAARRLARAFELLIKIWSPLGGMLQLTRGI